MPDELLNGSLFISLTRAQVDIVAEVEDYNG
jgi:hypothetical protein